MGVCSDCTRLLIGAVVASAVTAPASADKLGDVKARGRDAWFAPVPRTFRIQPD